VVQTGGRALDVIKFVDREGQGEATRGKSIRKKIYFVSAASEAEDAQDAFCHLGTPRFGQLASGDTQRHGRHLGDTWRRGSVRDARDALKTRNKPLTSRDTSMASGRHIFFPDVPVTAVHRHSLDRLNVINDSLKRKECRDALETL